MKTMMHLLQRHPALALVLTGIGFILCAAAVVLMAAILAVAFVQ